MGFVGRKPTNAPLTSSDLGTGIVGSTNIADGTIVNADINASAAIAVSKLTGTLPVANGGTGLTALGTSLQVLRTNTGATALEFATVSGTKFGSALFHVRDEKAATTGGGTTATGSFQKRTLNTTMTNEISGASIASSVITLPAGTYYINARVPFFGSVAYVKVRLRNTTDGTNTLLGSNSYQSSPAFGDFWVIGRFTIAAQKDFELQYRCGDAVSGNGLGHQSDFDTEVYADCQIWKVA